MEETIEQVSKFHVDFAKKSIKRVGHFSSMIVTKIGRLIMPIIIPIDRDKKKFILETLKRLNPDWLVYMDETYFREIKEEKVDVKTFVATYRHGDMERNFKLGDKEEIGRAHV